MSILLNNISKVYGQQKAVDDITFEVRKGEIVGFLGPNGAGKTTTMKIITSYLPPTAGEVSVAGFPVNEQPLEVRKRIGYLPEHNPLYREMYIREYLHFIAGVHGVGNRKSRIDDLISLTGLQKEAHKKIQNISKGYRQRVGLAQAMIHDPEVLILDEPTTGLDPNQLVEIRSLIKQFGKEKTVLFSSHILQEVQAICDRVIIINNGRLVANEHIDLLTQYQENECMITVQFVKDPGTNDLLKIPGVKTIKEHKDSKYKLLCAKDADSRLAIFEYAVQSGNALLELKREDLSIEEVFHKLTQSA